MEEAVSDLGPSPISCPPAKVCSNPKCENSTQDKLIKPKFTTYDKLAELFNTEDIGGPFALCRQCYYKAYTTICLSHTHQQFLWC